MSACPNPVFVIGSPRSGTSILPWSLAQHPDFWTSRESDLLYNLFGGGRVEKAFADAESRPEGTWLSEQNVGLDEFLAALGSGLNELFTRRSGGKRWVDQTPLNTLMLDTLARLFPGAYFLHILRDGRRVVNSMMNFANNIPSELREKMQRSGGLAGWSVDFREACRTWKQFVVMAVDFQRQFPHRCLTVRNDRLSADPHQGFREIFTFLEAPYAESSPKYFQDYRINSSFQQTDVRNRGERPVSELWSAWSQEQREVFVREAGETMVTTELATQDELR